MKAYHIVRPPLLLSFELPTREELLGLNVGDFVKLIFGAAGAVSERMWVKIVELDPFEWKGELNNEPYGDGLRRVLKLGDSVRFHPLDIIETSTAGDQR